MARRARKRPVAVSAPRTGRELALYTPPDRGPKDFRGRHLLWDPALAEEILQRISDGEFLIDILQDERMPSRWTVNKWARGEQGAPAEFSLLYQDARRTGLDNFAEEAFRDARDPLIAETRTVKLGQGGAVQEVTIKRDDNVTRSKLKADVRLRLLGMWDERYRQAPVRPPDDGGDAAGQPDQKLIVDGGLPEGEP